MKYQRIVMHIQEYLFLLIPHPSLQMTNCIDWYRFTHSQCVLVILIYRGRYMKKQYDEVYYIACIKLF